MRARLRRAGADAEGVQRGRNDRSRWTVRGMARALVTAVLLPTVSFAAACRSPRTAPEDVALDDGRQWLEPRATVTPASPALLRAAAASAVNQVTVSESLLQQVIRTQPASDSARRAHQLLSRIYLRSGQYQRLSANLDEWSRSFSDGADLRKEKADIEQFRGLPNQINGPRREATLPHGESSDFAAPLSINGQPATYLLDTGAWMSVMSEREASRLGMTVRAEGGVLADASGKGTRFRTAVAKKLTLGSMWFRDVSFAILPDAEPWRSMPPGRGGIIGIPILLETGCLRWAKGGTWELGCAGGRAARDAANLVFYENHLLVAATVSGTRVFGTLDTGAETTDLNANFARQFAAEISRKGVRDTTSVSGAGGTATIQSVTLPEVAFDIGGTYVALRPAHVTAQWNPALGGRCCIGNIGLDLLLQSGAVTIDFSSMTLRLRSRAAVPRFFLFSRIGAISERCARRSDALRSVGDRLVSSG